MSHSIGHYDLSDEAIAHMPASEALQKHLANAQLAHRVCVAKALKAEKSPVESCALTWGEVLLRYQQWADYRAPFQDAAAQKTYMKFWTKKRQAAEDNKV
ncbi:hypothetical protein STCU_03014 [Strigomonas culicis]|uniref:Uncharacterized protein n=1 Tax=Strigomonas culicis TaxID=28005 RepID=S9VY67_9TRYP|nr:hypothetical protein STCU_04332 [Strigomonas culicis]EPY32026.1 hypothetical protein STCU_03014 [Strigomonas culicis]|eukprot:EPY29907.1 hypothetical protein STCU_04332 [Strigomonas culicis]